MSRRTLQLPRAAAPRHARRARKAPLQRRAMHAALHAWAARSARLHGRAALQRAGEAARAAAAEYRQRRLVPRALQQQRAAQPPQRRRAHAVHLPVAQYAQVTSCDIG